MVVTSTVLLVQRGHSLSGLDLIQPEGESKATGQLLDAAHMRRCSVQVGPLILQQFVEQLKETQTSHTLTVSVFVKAPGTRWACSLSHLLQTENECLGTENLVHLSGFTESLLNDVTIIIVIL